MISVKLKRSCGEHYTVKREADHDVEIKYGRKIEVISVFLLNQCISHAAVNKDLHYGRENRDKRHRAIDCRIKEPGKYNGNNEGDALRAAAFEKTPQ